MKGTKRLWWGLILLILISPLGLVLPEVFKSGPAWGEWSLEEIEKTLAMRKPEQPESSVVKLKRRTGAKE